MTIPIPRHVSGEQVRLALMAAQPGGLQKAELTMATELTPSQVTNGIVWIRMIAASEHLTPLTYDRKHGYRFSDDPADWAVYEKSQMLTMLTRLLRLAKGTVDPDVVRVPKDKFARLVNKSVEQMLAALEVIESA